MKRNAAAALVLFLALTAAFSIRAQDEKPPYLFYYSQLLGGIIIERADGTDSRIIAQDVFPPDLEGLSGPGWSPSGRYFAANRHHSNPAVIDLQGNLAVDWFDNIAYAPTMQWSSAGDDILFVIGDPLNTPYGTATSSYWLADAATGRLLAEYAGNFGNPYYETTDPIWEPEAQQIRFYSKPEFSGERDRYFEITMRYDGTVMKKPSTQTEYDTYYVDRVEQSMLQATQDGWDYEYLSRAISVSPSGRYETVRGRHAVDVLTDHNTGEERILPRHTQATTDRRYVWNKDEQYFVTLDGTLISGDGAPPVLGIASIDGTLWRELGGCDWDITACVNWLPAQVDVSALPPGSPVPVQLDPARIEYEEHRVLAIYSVEENPNPILICGTDETAIIAGAEISDPMYQLGDIECPYNPGDDVSDEGLEITAAYDPAYDLLATYQDYHGHVDEILIRMKQDGMYRPIFRLSSQGYLLEFTDDGQYLRARNVNGWKVYDVAEILAAAALP